MKDYIHFKGILHTKKSHLATLKVGITNAIFSNDKTKLPQNK